MRNKLHLSHVAALLVVLALALSVVAPAAAQSNATIVNASRVNLRSGPGAGFPIVTVLSAGQQINLLGANIDGSWFQVQTTSNQIGWVASRFVAANFAGVGAGVTAQTGVTNAVVTTPRLNIRSGPGANFTDIGTLSYGDYFNLIGRNADNSWLQISIPGGIQGGWVSARYVGASVPLGQLPLVSNTGIAPTLPQAVELGGQTGIVTAPNLNVRYGPGTGFGSFARVGFGQGVSLIGRSGNGAWLLVQLADGRTGWVSTGFIRTSFPLQFLEVRD